MARTRLYSMMGLALLVVLFGAVNFAANGFLSRARIDLTQDQLYTLSPGTRAILQTIKQPITLRLYFSDRAASGFPSVKAYGQRVTEVLRAFERASAGKLDVRIIDPEPFTPEEDEAVAFGLQAAPVQGRDSVFFGLVGTNAGDGRELIGFFDDSREPQLEYEVARLIDRLANPKRPKIAILTTLPLAFEPGGPLAMAQGQSQPNLLYSQIRELFDVALLKPDSAVIPSDARLLMLAHPPGLSPDQLTAVTKFAAKGGALLVLIDPLAEFAQAPESPFTPNPTQAIPSASNLAPILAGWGLSMVPDQVVIDGRYAQQVAMPSADGQPKVVYFPPWLGVPREGMDARDITTSRLSMVNVASAGALTVKPFPDVTVTPLLRSSPVSALLPVAKIRFEPDPAKMLRDLVPSQQRYILAARVAAGKSQAIVIADSDILEDSLWARVQAGPGGQQIEPIADNGAFIINAIDSLLGSPDLISVRSRAATARPFTVIEAMKLDAARRFRAREALLQNEVNATEARIRELEGKGGGQGLFLTPAQSKEIARFRDKVLETRQALRGVQRNLRNEVEALQGLLAAINIAAVPLLLLIVVMIRQVLRAPKRRPQ